MRFKIIPFILILSCFSCLSFIQDGKKKIVFFGDSITELGVKKGGYIDLLKNRIASNGQTSQFDLLGAGIGGNKIYDLFLRLEKDVINKSPDVVVIWVGVNDVWHKSMMGTGTDYDKFGLFYDAVVQKIQTKGAKVILVTPAVIGERYDQSNPQDGELNLYSNWIRKYAREHQLTLVDCRKLFLDYSTKNNPQQVDKGILTYDRVHLNDAGNQLVADAIWEAIK
ncbi:MAG: SGNH/GDSL hydrolase family protein [Sediminibacterium sp.]